MFSSRKVDLPFRPAPCKMNITRSLVSPVREYPTARWMKSIRSVLPSVMRERNSSHFGQVAFGLIWPARSS